MRKRILIIAATLASVVLVVVAALWRDLLRSPFRISEPAYIYIASTTTEEDIMEQLRTEAHASNLRGWHMATALSPYTPRTGRYAVRPGESMLAVFRKLQRGHQEPIRLVVPATRGLNRLAGALAHRLMLDSAEIASTFRDDNIIREAGYTVETFPALFIPNTYEVYWDITAEQLMERLKRENDTFWNHDGREAKAEALNMSHEEVYTLASIVDEETAADSEKPDVAGLYLNRLRTGMPLQADPTVKFAVGDESLRRITGSHLSVESPYNTYKHTGLPPGPIRIASVAGIDAVLNASQHSYLYMCAKEDFSGRHNFAATFGEHQQNARRYQKALNARGIH